MTLFIIQIFVLGYFEQQLATLERLSSPTAQLDRGRAFGSLGDCYDALGDPEEAAKCHEQHLACALKLKSARDQERAYRGLGQAQKALGNLQQALVCLEKRYDLVDLVSVVVTIRFTAFVLRNAPCRYNRYKVFLRKQC